VWTEWQRLKDAVDTAQMPAAARPIAGASVEMMMGADLQWARFRASLSAPWRSIQRDVWLVEAHFFLIAADNARNRLAVWATMAKDDDARALAARLRNDRVRAFRNHQERVGQPTPGAQRKRQATLDAPGNTFVIEAGLIVRADDLVGHVLSFGDTDVDLAAVHEQVLGVAIDLLRWLQARSRFG
jgi:hypothetical protein